jgi:hypothetical protein
MRALRVVVASPGFDDDPRFCAAVEDFPVEQLVAKLRVEALAVAVSHGLPGSMKAVRAPTAVIHSRTALAMNSGP